MSQCLCAHYILLPPSLTCTPHPFFSDFPVLTHMRTPTNALLPRALCVLIHPISSFPGLPKITSHDSTHLPQHTCSLHRASAMASEPGSNRKVDQVPLGPVPGDSTATKSNTDILSGPSSDGTNPSLANMGTKKWGKLPSLLGLYLLLSMLLCIGACF